MTMLASVSLTLSCTKMERVQKGQEIVLSPLGSTMTKTSSSSPLSEDLVFGVYAYYSNCPGETAWDAQTAWPVASVYMSDAAFAHTDGYWSGTPDPYYWPLSGSLMFAGYCPHKDHSDGTITEVSLTQNVTDMNPYQHIKFTQKTDPAQMVDLLWFDAKDVAGGETISKTDLSIPIEFNHALSQVSFEFVDNQLVFQLDSVKLKDCINTSDFYSGNTPGWLPDINAVEDYVLLKVPSATTKPHFNGWDTDEMLYIIPQYLDGIFPSVNGTLDNGLDVVLEIALTDGFGSQIVEIPLKDYTPRWEMGKHYHYTISVVADPIDFTAPDFIIIPQVVSM